jgi:hypothetical protein
MTFYYNKAINQWAHSYEQMFETGLVEKEVEEVKILTQRLVRDLTQAHKIVTNWTLQHEGRYCEKTFQEEAARRSRHPGFA